MLDVRRWAEIRRMKEVEGLSIHEIVRRTGHDRNTVRRALRREGPPRYAQGAADPRRAWRPAAWGRQSDLALTAPIAMGGGSYLASEAEEGLYAAEIADEGREIEEEPEREIAELALVFEDEGLPRDAAEGVAQGLAANPVVFLRTKIQKELGLSPDVGGAALGDALVVGLSYMGAAVIPLWPYVLLPLTTPALVTSIVCTLVALFALGVAKGRIARQAWQRAGIQVMLIGSASAAVGFVIGHLVTPITGG